MATIFIKPPFFNASILTKWGSEACLLYKHKDHLLIGKHSGNIYRAVFQFEMPRLPVGTVIMSARFFSYIAFLENKELIPLLLDSYQILSKVHPKKISNHRPILMQSPPVASLELMNGPYGFVAFDLTVLVQKWLSGAAANLGILVKSRNETMDHVIGLTGKNYWDSQQWPYLEISYAEFNQAACSDPNVIDRLENVNTMAQWRQTAAMNLLCFNYSYIAVNTGSSSAIVLLQQSADGQYWQDSSAETVVLPGQSVTLIPNFIMKYARLCFKSEMLTQSTTLDIYLQGRIGGS